MVASEVATEVAYLAALHDPETEQQGDRADVRHEQIEEAGAANLGVLVLTGDQEVGRQRHQFPHHHEGIGVVGQQHQEHAGQKQVVLQAEQAQPVLAFSGAEIAGGEPADTAAGQPQQGDEERGKAVQPQVKGQVGQADRQYRHLRGFAGKADADQAHSQADQGAQGEKHASEPGRVRGQRETRHAEQQPAGDGEHQEVDGQEHSV